VSLITDRASHIDFFFTFLVLWVPTKKKGRESKEEEKGERKKPS
jgi:hypothetical protein